MKNPVFLLTMIFLIIISGCSDSGTSPVETTKVLTKETVQKFESELDKAMVNGTIPGIIVGVFTDDGESWIATRGVSNLAMDEPMSAENHFRVGSNTKTFVGTVVLQLVDEGLVNLDDPISKYLPDLQIPSGDKITVRMLGNMTSGLEDYSEDDEFNTLGASGEIIFTPEKLAEYGCRQTLLFEPGTNFYYCNTNFVLLGMLIEKVTGKTVKQNLEERIFNRLGLENTSWPITRFMPYPYAHGYAPSFTTGSLTDFTFCQPSWMDAAGILISNLYDLKAYLKELANGTLFSSQSKIEREKWNTVLPGVADYGFAIAKYWGWVGHTGHTPGYETIMLYNPNDNTSIIILINYQVDGNEPGLRLFKGLKDIL